MNTKNIPIALLALFLGALGLYIASQGQVVVGAGIMLATVVWCALASKKNKRKK